MADPLPLSRAQIAAFVGNDPQTIRTIERLIAVTGEETPTSLQEVQLSAAQALNQIQTLAGVLEAIVDNALPPVKPTEAEPDVTPRILARLDGLADVNAYAPATGDLLQFNGTEWVPVTGATGSFVSDGAAETITVTNGVITAIT